MVSPYDHILSIFNEYTTDNRLLRSFTNLSNTVIQTALSGQSKFVFEILQNADDAYENHHRSIEVEFLVKDDFFIVRHNGKGFDYNDVDRICDYASQIKEVKANDLSKTGYKGLGFKSLFNLSDTIYICSNGYSFRFDKTSWPNPENRPWQVIPIWCKYDELPLVEKYSYSSPVNIILRLKDVNQLKIQLKEVIDHPDLLLYLQRVNKLIINIDDENYVLERKKEQFGKFTKVVFFKNNVVESTWLTRSYSPSVPAHIGNTIASMSRFIYPDKIKNAKNIIITFALKSTDSLTEISKVRGLCYNTLPTQLHLMLPYHINSFFILNLDRTQLHENDWNTFLLETVGRLQLYLLRDLASIQYLKNYVISLYVREIEHPFKIFAQAFLHGLMEAKTEVAWLPSHQRKYLLKLGQAWSDDIDFFRQNFENVQDPKISPYLIDYRVLDRINLNCGEAEHFAYDQLLRDFSNNYFPQFKPSSYVDFISYLYERLNNDDSCNSKLRRTPFLVTKNGKLTSPKNAFLEESDNPIPDFCFLNPVNNNYLPHENRELIMDWLQRIGARVLRTPLLVIQLSILKWIELGVLWEKITLRNHVHIMEYLANHIDQLSSKEVHMLKENLIVFTSKNRFNYAKYCYLSDVVPAKELASVVSDEEKLSPVYNMALLKNFFIFMGVCANINPLTVVRNILTKLKYRKIFFTKENYNSIIEYIASNYFSIEQSLSVPEKKLFRCLPLLTRSQTFKEAELCFFDYAISTVEGFENIISPNEVVVLVNDSLVLDRFFTAIGVSKQIAPANMMRKSVLKWFKEGCLSEKITKDNHTAILEYITEHWHNSLNCLSGLKPNEKEDLKNMLILTRNNTLKPAYHCYWPSSSSNYHEEIPGIEYIVSSDEFVSDNYDLHLLAETLNCLGVRKLCFFEIYKQYMNHLNYPENVKWFFSNLLRYWRKNKTSFSDDLLLTLKEKFKTCRLLAINKKVYHAKQLYSSKFHPIHYIEPNSIPILDNEKLPEDLEKWLGFKMELDLLCIKNLFVALERNPLIGADNTLSFYKILLEQLKLKPKGSIKNSQFSLLSEENKLVPASKLYYFWEEEAKCELTKYYLKRISGMSHKDTLELAEMCGVNIVPFSRKVTPVRGVINNNLKEHYMTRLPFIVIQESQERNESPSVIMKHLFDEIDRIRLYECQQIRVQYPFGSSISVKDNFDNLTLHVVGRWRRFATKIKRHLSKTLNVKTNIEDIIDMDSDEDFKDWLSWCSKEDREKFPKIQAELETLKVKETNGSLDATKPKEDRDSSDDDCSDNEMCASVDSSSEEILIDEGSHHIIKEKITDRKRTSISESGENVEKVKVGVKCKDLKDEESDGLGFVSVTSKKEVENTIPDENDLEIDDNYLFLENNSIENILDDLKGDESNIRRSMKSYVFALLQLHYKRKYPNATCELLFNTFKLWWRLQKIDISWVTEKENSKPYDFELRKNGDIKQLIKFELTELMENGFFSLSSRNIDRFLNIFPKNYKKYCSYAFSDEGTIAGNKKSVAVYKVIPMQQFL